MVQGVQQSPTLDESRVSERSTRSSGGVEGWRGEDNDDLALERAARLDEESRVTAERRFRISEDH